MSNRWVKHVAWPVSRAILLLHLFAGVCAAQPQVGSNAVAKKKPIKVFILAGDENVLEHGVIEGHTDGVTDTFYPNEVPVKDEQRKHVNVAVYKGAYSPDVDYDIAKPDVTAMVELGDQRWIHKKPKGTGKETVPYTAFPDLSQQSGFTTVLRGWVTVPHLGKYEFRPGIGEGAFNVTTLGDKELYRRDVGKAKPTITPAKLEPNKRYAFRTIFFSRPSHAFRIPLLDKPGALTTTIAKQPRYGFLKNPDGSWATRKDVVIYDMHPIHNNDKTMGRFLQVGDASYGGKEVLGAIGPELMLGHALGNHFEEPVLLLRFGTRQQAGFVKGTRSLAHDYRPPSSSREADLGGTWDVIHFNWGVWDSQYRDKNFKFYHGEHPTSYANWEKNLRTLVARLKKTGATLIWASVTPVWEGTPDRPNADVKKFNAIAEGIMRENGVIIDDLHAESIRQGFPKSQDVHSVGHLGNKVIQTIEKALAERKNNTKPLPRVLLIGDSITGSYIKQVETSLFGKALVCMNPGNAEDTWNGLKKIDQWLDLKNYLLNGQEFLELTTGVKWVLDNLEKVYPGYSKEETEIAGMIWFQGTKDSQSNEMADEYEMNLTNLMKDLRGDFGAPALPVVVAALNYPGNWERIPVGVKKVIGAQLAVGNPEKHPDFAATVKSIDTHAFFHKPDQSPAGRMDYYHGNALSYLQIGEAMGQAMIDLITLRKTEGIK